jgi:tetratricopeptide (TPR) repeat protein
MRTVLYGLVVGFMLSALRAPLGLDLVEVPAALADTAYGYRGLALAVIAMACWLKGPGPLSTGFLASTALGFALQALFLSDFWAPSSAAELWLVALTGFAVLVWLGRGDMLNQREPDSDRPSFLAMIGLCAAGAGVAVGLESLARHVRLFGGGLPEDDSVSAIVLLLGLVVGALAGGWICAAPRLRALSFPAGLAATSAACFVSLHTLNGITSTRGLSQYLQAYGLDTSSHGMLAYDALIAASCFLLPAVLLGAALRGARSKLDLTSALSGAALGLYFVPRLMTAPETRGVGELEMFSAQLVPLGCLTAIGGAALALLATASLSTRARWSALTFTLLLCLAPLFSVVSPKIVIAPWLAVPPRQTLVFDSPEGLVTVEPSDGGLALATLDRHALTPPTEAAVADVQRIKLSVAMVPPERWRAASSASPASPPEAHVAGPHAAGTKAGRTLRVLLIGQLSPVREQAFKQAGVERIDRSAAWHRSMKRIDDALFEKWPAPLGDRLSPDAAQRKIDAGEYDLVVVAPVPGPAPVTRHLSVPDATTLVAWFTPEQWIVERNLGASVLYSSDGIDAPGVGVVLNGARGPLADGAEPLFVRAGEPVRLPLPLTRLAMLETPRFEERDNWCRASLARRLAEAARGEPDEKLMQGLAILYGSQSLSAEFETKEERTVLPREALELFLETALARPPSAFVRALWESLARVLLGKRAVADIYTYLQPLAEKYPPWPVLDLVLAQADLEALEPASAVRRLSTEIAARVRTNDGPEGLTGASENEFAARERDLALWYWLGEAQRQTGDHPAAARSWRRALDLQPENRALKRELAMELVRAADPDGRKMIEALLAETPDDAELRVFLEPGPYPEGASGSAMSRGKKPQGKSGGK